MEQYKWSDNHFGLAGINAGMVAFSALEGEAGMAAFNAGLIPLNMGLALKGREQEIRELREEAPQKALRGLYDGVLKGSVKDELREISREKEGGRGNQTSGRRICRGLGRRQV